MNGSKGEKERKGLELTSSFLTQWAESNTNVNTFLSRVKFFYRRAFNNHVDQILPNFETSPSPLEWTMVDILHDTYLLSHDQAWTFYWPPPPSSCPRTGCLILKFVKVNSSRGRKIHNFIELWCLVASRGLGICVSLTSFQKSIISWPQQFLTEGPDISDNLDFLGFIQQKRNSIGYIGTGNNSIIRIIIFFDKMRL